MSKRILSMVLMLTLVLGSFSMAFADTNATAALTPQEKIERLQELGYIEGHEDGDLRLDEEISRAQTAVIVSKALYAGGNKDMEQVKAEIEKLNYKSSFKDVAQTNWANPYINVAAQKEVIHGFPDNTFKPARQVQYREAITMMVGLIGEEPNSGKYPGNYITKAMELGLLDGLNIADYEDNATRQDVFEMLFNAVTDNKVGNYNIDKVIVLENNRVESINANEMVVEVIQEVQRANYVGDSRDNASTRRGEQLRITVPSSAKLDVEGLLGKVINLSYDKQNNAINADVDTSYEYKSGSMELMESKLKVDGKTYTVSKAERFGKYNDTKVYNDERIFNTYINNQPFTYTDAFESKKELDFGKVTIKNGKILFIDAFAFDDIAPVKEVDEDGSKVIVYNDMNDGGTKRIELKNQNILSFNNGSFSKIDKKDIEVTDVVHIVLDNKDNIELVVVRQDAKIDGEYQKVIEYKNGKVTVMVDEKEYEILGATSKKPVYAYDSKEFNTLDKKDAADVLKEFIKEEVTVLQDVNGDLQYLGSKIDFGEFVGIIDNITGNDVRILKSDDSKEDLIATLDTKYTGTDTGHKNLNSFEEGDLVFISASKGNIDKMSLLDEKASRVGEVVTKMNRNLIELITSGDFNVLARTNVFVIDGDKTYATTMKYVVDNYKGELSDIKAIVLSDFDYDANALNPRKTFGDDKKIANTIIFTDITIDKDLDKEIVEILDIRNKNQEIRVQRANGKGNKTYTIVKDSDAYEALTRKNNPVKKGDIVEVGIDKEEKDLVYEIVKQVDTKSGQVESFRASNRTIKLEGVSTTYRLNDGYADLTKHGIEDEGWVTLYLDTNGRVVAVVDGVKANGIEGLVTYINGTEFNVTVPNTTDTFVVTTTVGTQVQSATVVNGKANMATAFPAGNAGTAKLYNLKDLNTAIASTNFVVKAVSGFSGAMGTATPGVATVTAVPEVAGVDTVTFDVTEGNFVGGDTVTIDGKVLTFPAIYAGTNATDAAAQVKTLAEAVTALDDKYTITAAVGVLTFTEKAGKVDAVALTATTSNVYATVTAENTTLGTVEVTGVAGTNQIEKLTITKAASISAGEIVVTFNDGVQTLVKTVSIAGNEADADAVATKIAAAFGTELTNWDVTTSTADVVFTAKAKEANKTVKITVNEK